MIIKSNGMDWEFILVTSGESDSSTKDGKMYVTITGQDDNGNTVADERLKLDTSYNDFQKGHADVFSLATTNVDSTHTPTEITIHNDSSDKWRGYQAYLTNKLTGRIYKTTDMPGAGDFFEKGSKTYTLEPFGDGKVSELKPVSDVFQVDIHTSAEKNAATNGEVYVVLISEEGIASTAQRDKGDWLDSWEQGETCSCTLPKLFTPLSNIKHLLLFKISENAWLPDQITVTPGNRLPGGDGTLMKQSHQTNSTWLNAKDNDGYRNLVELEMLFSDLPPETSSAEQASELEAVV